MRWGLIARCDDRGLGHITWEVHRNLKPDRVLLVDMGDRAAGFAQRHDRYVDAPESWRVTFGLIDEATVREFADGLDVVYSAETFYDVRMTGWFAAAGVATVLHVMPEFFDPTAPRPTQLWVPTSWRLDQLPDDTRVVPVPVAVDRFRPVSAVPGSPDVLHIAGHRALHDRNGTTILYQAARMLRRPCAIAVRCQDRRLPVAPRPLPRGVTIDRTLGPATADYWRLYGDADVFVLPRRYGGLSLPVQEAAAAGMALVLPDVPPNRTWPGPKIVARVRGSFRSAAGDIPMHEADPRALAAVIDELADVDVRAEHGAAARAWAVAHSWDVLANRWLSELARVV